ncbi:MAG: hypothetical protein CL878_04915 [Dehalococcoidia bacterium]|nr:hypothetical protein [Dehalococcoidia bacterium]
MSVRRIALYIALALLLPLIAGGYVAFDIWWNSTSYVKTTDARVAGMMLAAAAPVDGRVVDVQAGIGDSVQQGDVLASISAIPSGSLGGQNGLVPLPPALSRYLVHVRSPVNGTILSRAVEVGVTVRQGQTLWTVGDLEHLWIAANVDETRIGRVQPGQLAEVTIEAVGRTLIGEVLEITPATSAILDSSGDTAAVPARSAGLVRITPSVPVRVTLPPTDVDLYPGMSAEVRIRVQ